MAFLQCNLPSSNVTGDVSEPTGNYHNKNSIHKLTAARNFLLPFASKSHSHDAAIRTIAQEEVKGELRKQGLTSLGDGISRTPARRALLGCAGVWGAHRHNPGYFSSGIGATAPLGLPECRTAQTRLGPVPAPAATADHKHGQGSKPGVFSVREPQETSVWELLESCLPRCCFCSICSQSQRMGCLGMLLC